VIQDRKIEYQAGHTTLEAYVAYDANRKEKKPCVLIAHAWRGRDELVEEKARALAQLGYVGVALDVYGKGVLGNNPAENTQLMQPLMADRQLLRQRLLAGVTMAQKIEGVDTHKMAAIGFCFGGLCVLDMARAGMALKGVVSFHGLLQSAGLTDNKPIHAKVLALHGHDDPMVPPEAVLAFETEMTAAKADWQLHVFGQTMHAFTNPQAQDPQLGTVYNAKANQRAWLIMQNFLDEIFA